MTSETKPTPSPLTDDTEVWKRTLAILAGLKQVAGEVRDEARQIETVHPNRSIKPGYGERVNLVSTLTATYAFMSADIHNIARSCGLTMPEELR